MVLFMKKPIISPEKWAILDNYVEDMLVAVKGDELSISVCKSYIVQYFLDAKNREYDEFIDIIEKRAQAARIDGWDKSH